MTTRATTSQTITTTGGGNLVGDDNSMIGNLWSTLLTSGSMREVATVMQTDTGANMPIPLDDNRDKAALVSINAAVITADASFGQTVVGAIKSGSMIKLPSELIQDSAIDIQAFAGNLLGQRFSRFNEEMYATGAATLSEYEGMVTTGSSGGAAAGTTQSSVNIIIADLQAMVGGLDNAYLNGASWMMHQTQRSNIAALLDGDGRPLWQPSLEAGVGDMLLGYPVHINNEYRAVATTPTTTGGAVGDKTATFGRHDQYLIRDVAGVRIQLLVERFADLDQVAVLGVYRGFGQYINGAVTNTTNASVKVLTTPAS